MTIEIHKEVRSVLILGSSGKQGAIWSKKLREEGCYVIGVDVEKSLSKNVDLFVQADIFSPEELSSLSTLSYDVLIVSVPALLTEAVIDNVIVPYGKSHLIVDLLSEKASFARLLTSRVNDISHIGIHLLFAPSLKWDEQNVLVTPRKVSDAKALEIIQLLTKWGCIVNRCDPLEHDRLMSLVQVSVHALILTYVQYLVSQPVDFGLLNAVSTPTSRIMWAMAARMISNDPAIYWDIQRNNMFATTVREQLVHSINKLDEITRNNDQNSFDTMFKELAETFGSKLEWYRQFADSVFDHKLNCK